MHMRQSFLLFTLILLVALPLVAAESTYPQIGGDGVDFLQGAGGFDTTVLSTSQIRSLSDGDHLPLVGDLDGNGINEIVVVDGNTVRLFQNTTLDVFDAITLQVGNYSAPVITDIDSDGLLEIIIANENKFNGNVTILEYNTSFTIQNVIRFDSDFPGVEGTRDILIQCSDNRSSTEARSCMYAVAVNSPGTSLDTIQLSAFNATDRRQDGLDVHFSSAASAVSVCLSSVPTMAFLDYDADGRGEFIFTIGTMQTSANEELDIFYVDVLESLNFSIEIETDFTEDFNPVTTSANCEDDNLGSLFSSAVLADFDGASSNGLEAVVALQEDADEFVLFVFDSTGSKIDKHPTVQTADGILVGNPMLANIFGDTGTVDYCAFGQDQTEQLLKLLCGSQLTAPFLFVINSIEFGFDYTGLFNLSNTYNTPTAAGHMSNMQQDSIDVRNGFTDTTEFVGTYGVFQVSDDDFTGAFTGKEMDRLFNINNENACIVVDYQQFGASDLICVRDTAVTYIDDNLVNGVAAIDAHTENPCIDSGAVRINTTMQVTIVAVDQNNAPLAQDLVTTRVTLYEGTGNEQVSEVANQTSGTDHVHLFAFPEGGINQTGAGIRLVYEAFDTENPDDIDTIVQTFTVSNVGNAFGDCVSSTDVIIEGEVVEDLESEIPVDSANNGVTNTIIIVNEQTGLGGGTIWLILIAIVNLGIWFEMMRVNVSGNATFGLIGLTDAILIIVGARLGIISTGIVVVITLVAVVIFAIFLGKWLTGTGTTRDA